MSSSHPTTTRVVLSPTYPQPTRLRTILCTAGILAAILLATYSVGILPVVAFLGSFALHEYGHYWGFKHYDIPVEEVKLSLVGGHVMPVKPAERARTDAVVALLGPLFGLLPVLVVYPLFLATGGEMLRTTYSMLVLTHMFNLIPYGGLDGGQFRDAVVHTLRNTPIAKHLPRRALKWPVTLVHAILLFFMFAGLGWALTLA